MTIHTTFAYGAGASGGNDLTFLPSVESAIRAFDNDRNPRLLGIMATHSLPAREQYVQVKVAQDPDFEKQEINPACGNDNDAATATYPEAQNQNFFPSSGRNLTVGKDFTIKGFSGGSDVFAVGIMLGYGPALPSFDPAAKTIYRRYNKGSDSTADVWTDCQSITDLDPDKNYVVVGMQAISEGEPCIGARLNMPETGCKPGVVCGPMIIFPEGAAIISGDSDPTLQTLVDAASEPEVIIMLQEYGASPRGQNSIAAGYGGAAQRGTGGILGGLLG